jgi:2,5-furandicarboxylate decarboxylase 1
MPKDLRSFIAEIDASAPEDLARVTKPLSPRYEMSAILTHLERRKRFPLLLFQNSDNGQAPVLINAQASRRLMSIALECKPENLARVFSERQSKPLAPVEMINAPVHEIAKTGDEIDLNEVPLLTHYDVNVAP